MPPKSGSSFAMVKMLYSDSLTIFEFSLPSAKVKIIPIREYSTFLLFKQESCQNGGER